LRKSRKERKKEEKTGIRRANLCAVINPEKYTYRAHKNNR